jgi:cephalosporin-C deacetylase-like acetyl esterase
VFLRGLAVLLLIPFALHADDKKPLPPAEAKAAFLKLLDRPKVDPEKQVEAEPVEKNGLVQSRWSFASEKGQRVPVLQIAPKGDTAGLPVMIVLHGTGGNKDGMISWLEEFAKAGIVGIAIDARYHGGRSGGKKGSEAYVAAITKAWRTPAGQPMEHPFYYDTVWDLWRLVDLLHDGKRTIGMLGISMGGIQTWLAASVDDRVHVAAPLIGVQSFKWSLENEQWQGRANTIKAAHEAAAKDLGEPMVNQRVCRELWNKVIPGILSDFDCPNLLRLFAGRALFVSNGGLDPNCPIEGARIALKAAEEAFAADQTKLEIHIDEKAAHTVTPEHRKAAMAFCTKWLKVTR